MKWIPLHLEIWLPVGKFHFKLNGMALDNPFPQRKRIRLQGYDYRQSGFYFVTICTQERVRYFGAIQAGTMHLSAAGECVQAEWLAIPAHYPHVHLHAFVVMPDHVHGIIEIEGDDITTPAVQAYQKVLPGGLPRIANAFKGAVTRRCRTELELERVWQKGYYERIIRDALQFENTTRYILDNPMRWQSKRPNISPGDPK